MEDDGFIRVWRSRRQRTTDAPNGRHKLKTAPCAMRVAGEMSDIETAMRKADERLGSDSLLTWMCRSIDDARRGRNVKQVLVFGNGNFDGPGESGAVQLALALRVAQRFTGTVYFQDPQCTEIEYEWLTSKGVQVRHQTSMTPPPLWCDNLMSSTETNDDDVCRVVFFVHNPHGLLEELLASEWKSGETARSILICNDYGDWTHEEFNGSIDGAMPHTNAFVNSSKIIRLPVYEPAPAVFHHTALIYIPNGDGLPDL